MRAVRYQVFISSTYRDLQNERQAVVDAILDMDHFPAGMELFPASDSTPWDIVEKVIDDSDYYVLIIGGMLLFGKVKGCMRLLLIKNST